MIRLTHRMNSSLSADVFGAGCFLGAIGLQRVVRAVVRGQSASFSSSSGASGASGAGSESGAAEAERVKSMLYTRTGDKGFSSLYNGERRSKNDMIFHTLGHQDELNAVLGLAREHCHRANNGLEPMLTSIQCRLFDLGAAVATPFTSSSSEDKRAFTRFEKHHTEGLEKVIDELDAQLPPLTNFVIPSGGLSSLHLNLARTVCRRAERSAVPLVELGLVDAEVGRYLNRLSDLLFAAGRVAVMREKQEEIIWVKGE